MSVPVENIKGSIASNLRRSLILQNFDIPEDSSSHNDKNCAVCQAEFGKIGIIHAKKNTCKFCNRGVCSKCSPEQLMHPGTKKLERICSACLTRMMESHFSQSFLKKIQDLKDEKQNREEEMKFMKYEKEMDIQENKSIEEKILQESQLFEQIRIQNKKIVIDLQEKQEELRISLRGLKEKKSVAEKDIKDFQDAEKQMISELTQKIIENDENFKLSDLLHEEISKLKKDKKQLEEKLKQNNEKFQDEQEKQLKISQELESQNDENLEIQRESLEILEELLKLTTENQEIEKKTLEMSVESEVHEKMLSMEKSSELSKEILKDLSLFFQNDSEVQLKIQELKDLLAKLTNENAVLNENSIQIKEESEKILKDLNYFQDEFRAFQSLNDSNKQDLPVLESKYKDLQGSNVVLLKSLEDKKQSLITQLLAEKSQAFLSEFEEQDKKNEEISEENLQVLQEIEKISKENNELDERVLIEELTSVLYEKHEDSMFSSLLESWIDQEACLFLEKQAKLNQNLREMRENHEKLLETIKLKKSNHQTLVSSDQSFEILQSLQFELEALQQSSQENKDLIVTLNRKNEETEESNRNLCKRLKETHEILNVLETSQKISTEYEEQSKENDEVSKENFEIFEEIQKLTIENLLFDKKCLNLELEALAHERNTQLEENCLIESLISKESCLSDLKISETTQEISKLTHIKEDLQQKSADFHSHQLNSRTNSIKLQEISESLIEDLNTLKETEEINSNSLSDLKKQLDEAQELKALIHKSIQDNENLLHQAMTEKIEKTSEELEDQNHENHLIRTENYLIIEELQRLLQENDEIEKIMLFKHIIDSKQDRIEIVEKNLECESKIAEENQSSQEKINFFNKNALEIKAEIQNKRGKIEEMRKNKEDFIDDHRKSEEIIFSLQTELLSFSENRKTAQDTLNDLQNCLKELQEKKGFLSNTLQIQNESQIEQFLNEKNQELSQDLESQAEENSSIQQKNLDLLEEIQKESTLSHFLSKQVILSQISNENLQISSIINQNSSIEAEILLETSEKHQQLQETLSSLQLNRSNLQTKLAVLGSSLTSTQESNKKLSNHLESLLQEFKDSKVLFDFHKLHLPSLENRYSSLLSHKDSLLESLKSTKSGISSESEESQKLSDDLETQNQENLLIEKENLSYSEEIQKLSNENQNITEKILSSEILGRNHESDSLISTSSSKYSPEEEEKIREFRQKSHENKIKINELKMLLEGHAIHKKRSLMDTDKGADPSSRPCARCLTF